MSHLNKFEAFWMLTFLNDCFYCMCISIVNCQTFISYCGVCVYVFCRRGANLYGSFLGEGTDTIRISRRGSKISCNQRKVGRELEVRGLRWREKKRDVLLNIIIQTLQISHSSLLPRHLEFCAPQIAVKPGLSVSSEAGLSANLW